MTMHVVLNHETNNIRRTACSHNEVDFPERYLRPVAKSAEVTSSFVLMPASMGFSDGDCMMLTQIPDRRVSNIRSECESCAVSRDLRSGIYLYCVSTPHSLRPG